ncbi:hypothetical protein TA3x_002900 [Tundrisphaera sp. TA3]|uniref:hypothetical protein n=1 Tax=Tundrisphaera sp. TA3 TaxID=3435775 RepID=UPI003EBEF599
MMRCEQAGREIATTPVGGPASEELMAHLAACPACSASSEEAARFDRAWAESRFDDLSPVALDRAWMEVARNLDRAELPPVIEMPARPRGRWIRLAIGLASAAALIGPYFSMARPDPVAEAPRPQPSPVAKALPRIEINLDETVLVRLDPEGPRVVVMDDPSTNPESFPSLADATPHDVMNAMESLAQ